MIALGALSLLTVVTLRQDFGGADAADPASLAATANSLIAFHDWTFLLGPAFCAGFGNGILLGYMMFKSGLMPRRLALIGLVGGPIAVGTAVAVLFGAYDQVSPIAINARGYSTSRIFQNGNMVASATQEGLIRPVPPKS